MKDILYALRISFRYFVLQLKIQKNIKSSIVQAGPGVEALNHLVDKMSRL
jgi:hypothetical protein